MPVTRILESFLASPVVSLVIVLGCTWTPATPARAFHAGSTFAAPGSAGGGGRHFYAGSARDRGWTCETCHIDATRTDLWIETEPPGLFESGLYVPSAVYTIRFGLAPETERGQAATSSNYNGYVLQIVDEEARDAGTVFGFAADRAVAFGDTTAASAGNRPGELEWEVLWAAPADGRVVRVHLAVVDGDGAGIVGSSTLTDPFGDAMAVVVSRLSSMSAAEARADPLEERGALFAVTDAGRIDLPIHGLYSREGCGRHHASTLRSGAGSPARAVRATRRARRRRVFSAPPCSRRPRWRPPAARPCRRHRCSYISMPTASYGPRRSPCACASSTMKD